MKAIAIIFMTIIVVSAVILIYEARRAEYID